MKHIGLTGGIGCGKTTVLREFQKLGVPCFIADQIAGKYYDNADFLKDIRALFGDIIFNPDGSVDKQKIAHIVFNDRDMLLKLNTLIHPRVMNDFRQWASRQTVPYVILESAIIYEYNLERHLDQVITVYLEKEERLRRLELRDRVSRTVLEERMRNQMSAEEKMDRADYVILNYEGNPRSRQVGTINAKIKKSIL